ncbi:MAG: glycosyltransferase [Acidobacteria bacterium]|nr:glycosyltransferase [Acidobacteriota bacterium]
MRILMVTSMLPYPESMSGGALVMYGQLTGLAARHDVTLATFAGADPAEEKAIDGLRASGIDVHYVWRSWPVGIDRWRLRLRDAIGWLQGGCPLRTMQFYDPRMQHLLDRLLNEQRFDLLQVEDNAMANYGYRMQGPIVLTEHEVRPALSSDPRDQLNANWIGRILTNAERRRWHQYQRAIWRRFNRIQVFTPRDAQMIRTMAPELAECVRVNPFGVEIPAEADPSGEEAGTIMFVGGFGHPPNVDAALWLGSEIMPRLRAYWPGVRLIIVGSHPTKAVEALACDDITVTGRVPAVEAFLRRAAVVLAPLRTGGGMRVKVLQAMALGKPVVTTPIGAEGLANTGGRLPLAIAEDAEGIARTTAALLGSENARHALGCRARAFVAQHHSWPAYAQRLEAIYAELQPVSANAT